MGSRVLAKREVSPFVHSRVPNEERKSEHRLSRELTDGKRMSMTGAEDEMSGPVWGRQEEKEV